MAQIEIPESMKPGLQRLRALSEDFAQELLDTLREEKPSLGSREFSSRVGSKVQRIEPKEASQVVAALISLQSVIDYFDWSKDKFVDDLIKSSGLEIPEGEQSAFRERLLQFLAVNSIVVTAKAFNILSSHEHTLNNVRILTDIRPIFQEDDSDAPSAAVIVHMLRISYKESQEDKEFFVAMDNSDIDKLEVTLKRAKAKAQSIQGILESTNVPYLGVINEDSTG